MVKTITVNGKNYTFYCDSRSTRNGFAHDCELRNGIFMISTATCYYYNRTWERYEYQTVMMETVRKLIDKKNNSLRMKFMEKYGYKRMHKTRRIEFEKYVNNIPEIAEYKELLENLK